VSDGRRVTEHSVTKPNRLQVPSLVQARLRREAALRAALARCPRAPHSDRTGRPHQKTRAPRRRSSMTPRHGPLHHPPPSLRPGGRQFARRHPEPRALRVATRWPPATLDTGHRRAGGLAIGSAALPWPAMAAHPTRTPEPAFATCSAPESRVQTAAESATWAGEAFRNEKVRGSNPLSSTKPAGQRPCPDPETGERHGLSAISQLKSRLSDRHPRVVWNRPGRPGALGAPVRYGDHRTAADRPSLIRSTCPIRSSRCRSSPRSSA
jgi:hypothetical protein